MINESLIRLTLRPKVIKKFGGIVSVVTNMMLDHVIEPKAKSARIAPVREFLSDLMIY